MKQQQKTHFQSNYGTAIDFREVKKMCIFEMMKYGNSHYQKA